MSLEIHENIKNKLKYFYEIGKIPNILFNGVSGSGKSYIVTEFINLIYDNDKEKIKNFAMFVNCSHGKGIKFIRDELKMFAKSHINSNGGNTFKSIILFNCDKLTIDAQSALRRCIELFSHNTRFFLTVEDKNKLLRPILSRFCEIYVPEPENILNLYKYNNLLHLNTQDYKIRRIEYLKRNVQQNILSNGDYHLSNGDYQISENDLFEFIIKIYEKGYSALDLIEIIENDLIEVDEDRKYEILITFIKIKKEFRNEKMLLFFIINFVWLDSRFNLENITFM
jgi:DNA polymerase III delta prime subunit